MLAACDRSLVMLVSSVALAGGFGAAAAAGALQFRVSVSPPPVTARAGGALAACPSPAGLERFNATTTKLAAQIASSYGRISLTHDLRDSDRAWRPQVRDTWRSGKPSEEALHRVVYGSGEPLSKSSYSVIVRFSCGQALVRKSLTVRIGPRQSHPPYCDACTSTVFFVDRRGRALIYYLY
jgi:hypothetical protein